MELKNGRLEIRHILLVGIAYMIFSIYALYVNGVGTNAPVMMSFYQINAAEQGFFMTMQAIGSLCALIYIALRGERYNKTVLDRVQKRLPLEKFHNIFKRRREKELGRHCQYIGFCFKSRQANP